MISAYQLEQIKLGYDNGYQLDIPKLEIPSGSCTALLGDNGAGKSTLLNILAFLHQPNSGKIVFFDDVVNARVSRKQRNRIGVVGQQPYLLKGSVYDNTQLPLKLQAVAPSQHKNMIEQALYRVGLADYANQPVSTLSGGQHKRVAIARAIVHQPDVLLLDEPFSHLDQHHIQLLEDIIQAEKKRRTVIFSTHNRLQAMVLADTSINLVNGQITQVPLLNLFHGSFSENLFNTGKLVIHAHSDKANVRHIAIDPREIIVSTLPLTDTSMLNNFEGRLTTVTEEAGAIRLCIECGERFHAIITPESLHKLKLTMGNTVWISFKATAVTLF